MHAERYIATSARGEHVVRTNSYSEALAFAARLNGLVIDLDEVNA